MASAAVKPMEQMEELKQILAQEQQVTEAQQHKRDDRSER